jgi:anthranilate phosphoribosyltransferase
MKEILNYLYDHKTLTKAEAKKVLTNMANGLYNNSQIASFISVYLMRAITVDEISGFRDALLDLCIPVDLSAYDTIDLCGTGGDGKDTFNISTLASFVVAGAGGKVAKHGNYAVSSTCGSSNIFEYFGYKFSNDEKKLKAEIEKTGICFLHAPLFNPAMKNVAPVRKELAMKTFFNMLGPMVNPSFPKNQMVGVFSLELARLYSYLYQQWGKNFNIIHGLDGYDEVSLTGGFKSISNQGEHILQPGDLNLNQHHPGELAGGTNVKEAASIFESVLKNEATRAQHEVTVANAALGLKCLNPSKSIAECVAMADESIRNKRAYKSFTALMEMQS